MNSSLVDNYKSKKKQDLLAYAKVLESLITLENNTLWHKTNEAIPIFSGVIDYFVDRYYFDNNLNRFNPVEYLNDNINAVLISIMEYYKTKGENDIVKIKKNETFLISVIICTSAFVDIASNIIDGNYSKMKTNFQKLLKHLSKTEILKIYYNNKMYLNNLFTLVKKNNLTDKKFFNSFKNDKWHNEYQLVSKNPEYYKVRFIYKIPGIEKYEYSLVNKYQHKYLTKFLDISYELLTVLLMKEFIMNKKVNTYLIPVVEENTDLDILNIDLFKDNIKLLVPIEKYELYKDKDCNIVYSYKGLDDSLLMDKENIEVLVSKEFIEKYQKELPKITLREELREKSIKEEDILVVKEEK